MEITKEQMLEIVNVNNELSKAHKQVSILNNKLWEIESKLNNSTWRNTNLKYWKDICEKYNKENLLNCYGDIFLISDNKNGYYIGRRVLWNLGLSNEQYEIRENIENDCDGEYDYTDYEIEVIRE